MIDPEVREGTIWMMDLDQPGPVVIPLVNASFKRLGLSDLPALGPAMGAGSDSEIKMRFDTGRQCFGAWVDGRLASFGWVSFDEESIGEINLRLRLKLGEAYIWNCVTKPEIRNFHLYSALLSFIVGELATGSLCRVWIGADQKNVISQHGMARAGFTHVADLVITPMVAERQLWIEGIPGIPEGLVSEARRVFLNDRDKV